MKLIHILGFSREGLNLTVDTIILPTKKHGLYWFETTLTNEQLSDITPPNKNAEGLIPIRELVSQNYAYQPLTELGGWRVVYNGICTKTRERIQQHIRATGNGTGRLGLNAYPKLRKAQWRISYYLLSESEYNLYSNLFEKGWRGLYGWPTLCRN